MKICPDITEKNADWEVTNQIKETNHPRGAMCIYIMLHYNKSNKYSLYMITKTITIDFLVDTVLLNMFRIQIRLFSNSLLYSVWNSCYYYCVALNLFMHCKNKV